MNFAPVVDVNINPLNPIIGNRSFGENPYNVTEKGIAFTKGIQIGAFFGAQTAVEKIIYLETEELAH